jgi:hypothetical protein
MSGGKITVEGKINNISSCVEGGEIWEGGRRIK